MEELWHLGMGLGSVEPRFRVVHQGEINPNTLRDKVIDHQEVMKEENEGAIRKVVGGVQLDGIQMLAQAAGLQNEVSEEQENVLLMTEG